MSQFTCRLHLSKLMLLNDCTKSDYKDFVRNPTVAMRHKVRHAHL